MEDAKLETQHEPPDSSAPASPSPDAGASDAEPEPESRDGLIEVRDGKLHLQPPRGLGAIPTLEARGGVQVRLRGQPAAGRFPLEKIDDLEVILPDEAAESHLEVEVTSDRMEAYLTWVVKVGRRMRLRAHPPARHVVLEPEVETEGSLPQLTPEEIVQTLREHGVLYGLLDATIARIPQEPNRRIKVAEGVPPQEPKDGRVRIPVLEEAQAREKARAAEIEEAQRLDVIRELAVPSVMVGEVAAFCEPPEPGTAGRDVTGNEVPARSPKPVRLTAGPGCRVEEGRVAYAERTGRPELRGDTIQIVPMHEVRGDLTAKRGHVRFDGDIQVGGSVTESVRLESGGQIRVVGSVSGAYVAGLTGIVIQRAAISSQLVAGGSFAFAAELLGPLEDGIRGLSDLEGMADQVLRRLSQQGAGPASGGSDATERGLLERLLQLKFKQLPDRLTQLGKKLMEHPALLGEQDQVLAQRLVRGLVPGIRDGSLLPLREPVQQLETLRLHLQHHPARSASITVDSLQNSRCIASGTLEVTGKAIYNSQVYARMGVKGPAAQLIGGSLRIQSGHADLGSVGAEAGTVTYLEFVEGGVLHTQRILPNVQVRIGQAARRIEQEIAQPVRVKLNTEGEVVVEPDR
ncbi:FapA family protein [Limnochorda pilosa]|uniref:Flagellar Assembly Protein A N-terminal region domain-containing protein n=1 Tax=Limnochorda pilosa TaxID=1555112 RepID=A0A0K2SNR9_LIMPI|nr:FapA family protein [Limnochorda pilosa]BAS28746.1 hypothetical protein LIP_2917 [Limnochorda pilosa]